MVRVGVALLPETDPATDTRWRRVEELGFAHAWCFDHLAWRSLADSPWHATVPVLTAAAMTTSTIRIGTFVTSPNYRHPVVFSKDLMTIDVMSRGRLTVGIGAGAPGFDAAVLGAAALTFPERQSRFEEFVALLDALLRRSVTDWDGAYFHAVEARTIPGPTQRPRPPFVIAGNGPRGMRLALEQGDAWVTMGTAPHGADEKPWWDGVAEAMRRFEDLAERSGRTLDEYPRYLDLLAAAAAMDSVEKLVDDIGRAGELGYTDVVIAWPRPDAPFAGTADVLDRLAERLVDGELR